MAMVYIKSLKQKNIFYKIKIRKNEKNIIYLPITDRSSKRKIEKVTLKLSKYLCENNIKNIVLEQKLYNNEKIKDILRNKKIHILDGTTLNKFLICGVIEKIYECKNKRIETGEITLLADDIDDIIIEDIQMIAEKIKRLNIITMNINKLKKIVDYLYNDLGILIKLSNNFKLDLKLSDIIVNVDFSEEMLNNLNLPSHAVILNIPRNINITSKKFSGVNIKNWEVILPDEYNLEGFDNLTIYEANIYGKTISQIFEQIQKDKIQIGSFIGVNGIINYKEFIEKT